MASTGGNNMRFAIDLSGAKDLSAALLQFGEEVQAREMKKALKDAALLMETAIKDRAPDRTGATQLSIGSRVRHYPRSQRLVVIIGPRYGVSVQVGKKKHEPARVAHLVEFGHAGPHPAPAHPFLRPAFDEKAGAAVNLVMHNLQAGVKRAQRRAARQAKAARR